MKEIKKGNKKCPHCNQIKLIVNKTTKYYSIYICKNCQSKYKESKLYGLGLAQEIIKIIRSYDNKIYLGSPNNTNTYYLNIKERFGNLITYIIANNKHKYEIIYDIDDPELFIKDIKIIFK